MPCRIPCHIQNKAKKHRKRLSLQDSRTPHSPLTAGAGCLLNVAIAYSRGVNTITATVFKRFMLNVRIECQANSVKCQPCAISTAFHCQKCQPNPADNSHATARNLYTQTYRKLLFLQKKVLTFSECYAIMYRTSFDT